MSFVVLAGNPRPRSRTLQLARQAAAAVREAAGLPAGEQVIDLAGLAGRLLLADAGPAVAGALEQAAAADLLLVASPTYKGTYTGLLKAFLDRYGHRGLAGVTALPVLVMGAPQHALAVDVHLRPLLLELGASVPGPGLAFLESDLAEPGRVLGPWSHQVAAALARVVPALTEPARG